MCRLGTPICFAIYKSFFVDVCSTNQLIHQALKASIHLPYLFLLRLIQGYAVPKVSTKSFVLRMAYIIGPAQFFVF